MERMLCLQAVTLFSPTLHDTRFLRAGALSKSLRTFALRTTVLPAHVRSLRSWKECFACKQSRILSMAEFIIKVVADAPLGMYVSGLTGTLLDLFTQSPDMYIHSPHISGIVCAPYQF